MPHPLDDDLSGVGWNFGCHSYTGPERRKHRRGFVMRYIPIWRNRVWSLTAYSETIGVRVVLFIAGSIWAYGLLLPGDTFERPIYRYMHDALRPQAEAKWAVLWVVYSVLMFWRIFAVRTRPVVALAVNAYGALLYSAVAIALYMARTDPMPAALAADFALAAAAAWVLVRTNIHSSDGWRND